TADRHGDHTGTNHLDPDNQLLHSDGDRFEQSGIPTLVPIEYRDLRAPRLRFPAPHATTHSVTASCRGAGPHPVRLEHGGGPIRRHPRGGAGRHHRPIRAPQHEHPDGVLFPLLLPPRSHQPTSRTPPNVAVDSPTADGATAPPTPGTRRSARTGRARSEEHTSELQSRFDLVCRPLL